MIKKKVENLMNKGFLLSVGLASIGKDKLEKIIKQLIRKGKISEKDGRKIVRDLIKKSRDEKKRIQSKIISVRKKVKKKIAKKKGKK